MDDLISRQAAITAIQKAYCDTEGGEDWYAVLKNTGLTEALHIMQDLPAAQPERMRGKWIRHTEQKNIYGGKIIECSVCGEKYVVQYVEDEKYCRNCGADMRGREDG